MVASTETKGSASVEAWLESFDVTDWDLRMVSLSDIDKGASRANQARLEAIDPTLAERYTQSAKAGAVFPPLVLAEVGKRLIVVDGNHRHEGLIGAKRVEHLAYVIKVTEALRHVMSAAANTLNGQPPTDEERRFHALQLSAGGYTQPRIAAMTGLTLGSVSRILRADRARKRCNDQRQPSNSTTTCWRSWGASRVVSCSRSPCSRRQLDTSAPRWRTISPARSTAATRSGSNWHFWTSSPTNLTVTD